MVTRPVAAEPCAVCTRKYSVVCVQLFVVAFTTVNTCVLLFVFSEAVDTVNAVPLATMAVPPPAVAVNTPAVAVVSDADALLSTTRKTMYRVLPVGMGSEIALSVLPELKSTSTDAELTNPEVTGTPMMLLAGTDGLIGPCAPAVQPTRLNATSRPISARFNMLVLLSRERVATSSALDVDVAHPHRAYLIRA